MKQLVKLDGILTLRNRDIQRLDDSLDFGQLFRCADGHDLIGAIIRDAFDHLRGTAATSTARAVSVGATVTTIANMPGSSRIDAGRLLGLQRSCEVVSAR